MASTGVKRPLDEDATPRDLTPEPPSTIAQADASSTAPGSPLSSVGSLPSKGLDVPASSSSNPQTPSASKDQNAKRRKLTLAEKEAAKAEKERKTAEREAEKQRKLEEKKMKDEEKEEKRRVKEAEKANKDAEKAQKEQEKKEKQEKRDAEKKAKEEEKKAVEEAKAKKERAQMRLTGFFNAPKEPKELKEPSATSSTVFTDGQAEINTPSRHETNQASPAKQSQKPTREVQFLPFAPPSHCIVAPYNRYLRDGPSLQHAMDGLDACLKSEAAANTEKLYKKRSLADALQPPIKRIRYTKPVPLRDIVAGIRGTQTHPIDLTHDTRLGTLTPQEALSRVRVKSFKYKEDVRPPYIGTYTKAPNGCSVRQLSRYPFKKASTRVNYDYDSEAEWEEPEEGEDLNSEGEEEMDEDEADDMDGFLDDEGAEGMKRQQHLGGDMEPIYTPIHWEPSQRTADSDVVPYGTRTLDLKIFRIATFIEQPVQSIDPYSTEYWEPAPVKGRPADTKAGQSSMAPPRVPLNSIPGATNLPIGQAASVSMNSDDAARVAGAAKFGLVPGGLSKSGKAGKSAAPIPPELLDSFKAAIKGSTLTKVGLIEVLKSQFPSVSKVTVQDTLEQVAERVGAKAADKQWVLKA